jgi:hypothetical protein
LVRFPKNFSLDLVERVLGELMAISEASRHEMHTKLEEVLGAQVAATMMEHLPPVGWADVATRRDLDAVQVLLESKLDGGLARVTAEVARSSAELSDRLRTQTWVVCTTLIAGLGVFAAIARG